MAANPYPSYLEMRQPLPLWVWHALRAAVVVGAFGLIAVLFAAPRAGLIAWWLYVLPTLPLLLVLAPGIWRNVCPMAALNQVPRLFGFARGLTVPTWLARQAILIQATLYFALISTRAPWLDHRGWAVATMMLLALGAAFAGGLVFKGKSGWCGTFCPLMPIQRLYGQTPAVVVPNSHCSTCVGCTPNCLDFNPRLAVVADVHEGEPYRIGQLKLFAGAFPGFVVAFFTVPGSVIGAPADLGLSLGRYYGLTAVYMLVSLGAYLVLEALAPVTPLVLMAVFGALGLNLHNILRFSTAFQFEKPAWLLAGEWSTVAAVTAWFVVRTYRHERRVAQVLAPARRGVVGRPGPAGAARAEPREDTAEVGFSPDGPRIVVPAGTTLLEAAERAGLQVEPGCRMGVCGADPIAVLDGADRLSPPSPGERSTLQRLGLAGECRMACSARVHGDVDVSLELQAIEPAAPARIAVDYDRSVRHVVVIGNGIAGSTAADHVRRRHPDCTIDVVGAEVHPTYNRMGISRLVYGRSEMAGLRLLTEDWYDRNRITPWLNTLVDEIDRDAHEIVLGTGERLPYDRVILAMGAAAWVPPVRGLDHPGVFVLRKADDAIGIRAHAQRSHARRAVVVGGGLLGLEAAHALQRFGLRTTVVQRGPQLLPGQLDRRGAELLERYFLGLGVSVVLDAEPVSVEEVRPALGLELSDGTFVPADIVVVCAGIRPAVQLARRAGLEVAQGVVVDARMRTSDPAILAAGDVAEHLGVSHGLWPVAVAQAEVAAANAVGDARTYEPQPAVAVLKGVGLSVKSAGDVEGRDGDEIIVHEPAEDEVRYWRLVVRDDALAGAVLLGEWADGTAVVDAVAAGADVSGLLPALRSGDLSPLTGEASPLPLAARA
jgi:NADPH-dependent 2,4-dienoyl-CoA reductase/sulfur reductase-like enzyme/ferredoxin